MEDPNTRPTFTAIGLRLLAFPSSIAFVVLRFVVRAIGIIILPVEIVFTLFGFGIGWMSHKLWHSVLETNNDTVFTEEADNVASNWKQWGRHMTEAGYDTLTVILMIVFISRIGFGFAIDKRVDAILGNREYLFWFPFWLASFIPFIIRIRMHSTRDSFGGRGRNNGMHRMSALCIIHTPRTIDDPRQRYLQKCLQAGYPIQMETIK